MKLSLRNLALAGVLMAAGTAMAAVPTVKMNWQRTFNSDEVAYNESRMGAGANGKVYFCDKANKRVMVYDGTELKELAKVDGVGVGVNTDDAGNVLVNRNFPGNASSTSYTIISPDGQTVKNLDITLPEGIAAGRTDVVGRIVGDLLSEEGAIFYVCPKDGTLPIMVYVQNGEQADGDFSFFVGEGKDAAAAFSSTTLAQPRYTFDELIEMGDDAVFGCVIRTRSTKGLFTYDGTQADGKKWVSTEIKYPATGSTQDGFDIFNLGGVEYSVCPTGQYGSPFVISDAEGNAIYNDERGELGTGGYTNGNSITAHKVDDNTVEIYTWYPFNGKHQAAMFTVTLPSEEPAKALYACGTINGWDPENAVALDYADGKYTLDLGTVNSASFKLSTVKGPWDNADAPETSFNYGVLGINEDGYDLVLNQTETLVAGAKGNINVSAKGTYKVIVDLAANTIVLTGEAAGPEVPEVADIYVRGAFTSWSALPEYKLNPESVNGTSRIYKRYIGKENTISGEFKIGDDTPNWVNVNFGAATAGQAVVVGPTFNLVANGQNFMLNEITDITFEFTHSGDPAVPSTLAIKKGDTSGVEAIEVADDANAVYYNLQGVEVNADNLTAGVYVKVAGGKASKVLVK